MKYALMNGIILDGSEHMEPVSGKAVLINNGIIEDIVDEKSHIYGYEKFDLKGQYLMPGLINMHVHLAGTGKPPKKQRDNTKLVKLLFSNPVSARVAYKMVADFARTALMSGVTTVRTVGGLRDYDTRVRDEILEGKLDGPRILAANEGISVPGGHMAGSVAVPVSSPEEAAELVRKSAGQKVDLIKLMITGGVMDAKEKGVPGELKMSPEIVRAACEEAHRLGFKVAAHTESPEGVRVALENGVDSIEHGAKPDEEILRLFKEKHAFLTTTLSPALPYALFDRSESHISEVEQYNGNVVFQGIIENSKAALAEGIPVALGNDVGCPYITQYDFWRELVYFHKYVGVSNRFALYTATKRNAELAGIGDITGSVETGKCADLIVTKKNPLDDLKTLRNVTMVIARGIMYEHPEYKHLPKVEAALDPYLD